jgi:hypothetical protein
MLLFFLEANQMEVAKLKLKIGEHEFEAEGPAESVQAQFEAFKELIATVPTVKGAEPECTDEKPSAKNTSFPTLQLEKITEVNDRIVSLTVSPNDTEEALLLILLGHRIFRESDSVTGSAIMSGLRQSGHPVTRIDRMLDQLSEKRDVITVGVHRARRYRLTNQGMRRAQDVAKSYIATLPE